MATKLPQEPSTAEVEELLETVDKNLDRVKVLYEQYFLGIQKQVPTHPHNDVERRLRDLTQMQLRSTRLRYRLVTLQQKFGSYNSYWRRTLRQIENGTYFRNLHKIGREAARTGAQVPEEILAAMPKRMRDQVVRDREQALALAARRQQLAEGAPQGDSLPGTPQGDFLRGADSDSALERSAGDEAGVAMIEEPAQVRHNLKTRSGAHIVDDSDSDLDIEAFFRGVESDVVAPPSPVVRPNPIAPGAAAAHGDVHVEEMHGPFLRTTKPPEQQHGSPSSSTPVMGSGPAVPRTATAPAVPRTATAPAVPRTATAPAVPRTATAPAVPRTATAPAPPMVAPVTTKPPPTQRLGGVPVRPSGAPPIPRLPTKQNVPPAPPRASVPAFVPPTAVPGRTTVPVGEARSPTAPAPIANPDRPKTPLAPPQRPPPGMTDADVNALYANYIKAKEMVGDQIGPGEHNKLLKTINAQAPKIMQQYNAKAVDFSVVVKDNQVILRAKPKLKPKP